LFQMPYRSSTLNVDAWKTDALYLVECIETVLTNAGAEGIPLASFNSLEHRVTQLGFASVRDFCKSFRGKFVIDDLTGHIALRNLKMKKEDDILNQSHPEGSNSSTSVNTSSSTTMSDKIHFKITHSGETRRFALSCDEEEILESIKTRVSTITGSDNVALFWNDDESTIVLEGKDDMEAAVDYALFQREMEKKLPCIRLETSIAHKKKEEPSVLQLAEESAAAFGGTCFYCNECEVYLAPSNGGRYKCTLCDNYDLCAKCVAKGVHDNHALVRLLNSETAIPLVNEHGGVLSMYLRDVPNCTPTFVVKSPSVKSFDKAIVDIVIDACNKYNPEVYVNGGRHSSHKKKTDEEERVKASDELFRQRAERWMEAQRVKDEAAIKRAEEVRVGREDNVMEWRRREQEKELRKKSRQAKKDSKDNGMSNSRTIERIVMDWNDKNRHANFDVKPKKKSHTSKCAKDNSHRSTETSLFKSPVKSSRRNDNSAKRHKKNEDMSLNDVLQALPDECVQGILKPSLDETVQQVTVQELFQKRKSNDEIVEKNLTNEESVTPDLTNLSFLERPKLSIASIVASPIAPIDHLPMHNSVQSEGEVIVDRKGSIIGGLKSSDPLLSEVAPLNATLANVGFKFFGDLPLREEKKEIEEKNNDEVDQDDNTRDSSDASDIELLDHSIEKCESISSYVDVVGGDEEKEGTEKKVEEEKKGEQEDLESIWEYQSTCEDEFPEEAEFDRLNRMKERTPAYLHFEILAALKGMTEEDRLAYAAEIKKHLKKNAESRMEHETIFTCDKEEEEEIISMIAMAMRFRLRDLESLLPKANKKQFNRIFFKLLANLKMDREEDAEIYREAAHKMKRCLLTKEFTFELFEIVDKKSTVETPSENPGHITAEQKKILTQLFKTGLFEDYEKMILVCRNAKNIEDAIDQMLQ
ncbi:hypothetical protein PFISCL1PPCAC_1597, partial [Pristionchus fissidentatus]